MNETLKTILSRRSVRSYTSQPIDESTIKTVLEAGAWAPSANNNQSWHFTAVLDRSKIDQLDAVIKSGVAQSSNEAIRKFAERKVSYFYDAPALILVSCAKDVPFQPQSADSACAMQNMMIAATSLGLGSCWVHAPFMAGVFGEFRASLRGLGVPEDHTVYGSVIVGYPADAAAAAPPRKGEVWHIVK